MCVISFNIIYIVLCIISKPLAQQILCLSHRGSATTLSVVLNSYLFTVSASAITTFLTAWQSPISPTRHMETTQFLPPVTVKTTPIRVAVRISCYFPDICIQLFAFFLRQRWRQEIPLRALRLPDTMHVSRSSGEVKLFFPVSFLHINSISLCILLDLFSSSRFSLHFPKSCSDHWMFSARQHKQSCSFLDLPQHRESIWAMEKKTFTGLSGAFNTTVAAVPSGRESWIVCDLQLVTCSELLWWASKAEQHGSGRIAVSIVQNESRRNKVSAPSSLNIFPHGTMCIFCPVLCS